jgi:SNF2 family DNA or RNA helicase
MSYHEFLERKKHSTQKHGIKPLWIPDKMFDFQKYVAEFSIEKGRCADFIDTGLGKTYMELVIAANYVRHSNKPVLIIAPLAVAFQFVREAEKFGIEDVEYSKLGKYTKKIIICNYERLQYFDPNDFCAVFLDESSILKNAKGATKKTVTEFLKKVKYRFLATATPSPNDFIELGTSSEALGYMGYTDMLTKFFRNNEDTISPQNIGTKWLLKPHAKTAFFEWVSTWAISMRKPSDHGFSDEKHILPQLFENDHWVKNTKPLVVGGQYQMFNIVARTNQEVLAERRSTVYERCDRAIELAANHETSVYWCNLNDEADYIEKNDPDAVQIKGGMSIDQKEEMLLAFLDGQIKHFVTKPKITGFGLNWQHCNHTTVFPGFSYEQYYQLVRRFLRFGQQKPVIVDRVFSDGQVRVLDSLNAKEEKSNELFEKLNSSINRSFEVQTKGFEKQLILPSFLK